MRLGSEVEFKPSTGTPRKPNSAGKRVDVLWNGLTITEPRKEKIAFTTPYLENHQIVIVTAASAIKPRPISPGKVIGVQEGSSAVEAIRKGSGRQDRQQLKKFGDNVTA